MHYTPAAPNDEAIDTVQGGDWRPCTAFFIYDRGVDHFSGHIRMLRRTRTCLKTPSDGSGPFIAAKTGKMMNASENGMNTLD